MRIAYLCNDRGIPVGGTKGASIHVRGVVEALRARGHEVPILAARQEKAGADGSVVDVGFDRVFKEIQREVEGDDVLASEAHKLLLNHRALESLAELHDARPLDAIYERYSLWSWAGLHFARRHAVPWVLEVNAPLVDEQRSYRELSLEPVARALERLLLREADAVIVPAAELREHVHRLAGRRRVVVLPNGVDESLFAPPFLELAPEARRHLEGKFVVAFLGSLKPWHGLPKLLKAFQRLRRSVPHAHLLVVGSGPLWGELQEEARRLGPDAITLTGAVPHDEVPAWLGHAHVGVAPYPDLPGFYFSPLKVVEYLAMGLPVVASSLGQVPELVQHERTGLLVPPGRVVPLAQALRRLHRDEKLRRRMGGRARQRARKRHGWSRVAARVERLLEQCAERKRGKTVRTGRGEAE
jgi:glycosyltransferase involved in cell wall biosynthesis